jgi:glucose/mannose-6-phosphate isomerase
VGPDTLCIVSSYSGNTEETLTAYDKCVSRKAMIIAISTGGELEKRSKTNKNIFCKIPDGLQPRAALGYSFSAIFSIIAKSGILHESLFKLAETAEYLKTISEEWSSWTNVDDNPPLKLAMEILDKIPVIYGSSGYAEAMSYRWKCQFNENAKTLCYWSNFPELNHNEIVGWGADENLLEKMCVIMFRDKDEYSRVEDRIKLTKKLLEKKAVVKEVYIKGKNELEKIFYLNMFGDLLTIYLAYLREKDPSEIQAIDWLKNELGKLKMT